MNSVKESFDLTGRVAVITGGAGLLGVKHAEAIAGVGGVPVLLDLDGDRAAARAAELREDFQVTALGLACDITCPKAVRDAAAQVLKLLGRIDILINNAANNPKLEGRDAASRAQFTRFESFPFEIWQQDLAVGLTGALLCSQVFGTEMALRKRGVILNIASDLAVIAPDQRIYRRPGLAEHEQPAKPVSYSVVKTGLIGLTRYLATYWAEAGVRANALSPGGVFAGQDDGFVQRLTNLIPLARMARPDEYRAAVVFLVSDASAYLTGANIVMDGGRSCW